MVERSNKGKTAVRVRSPLFANRSFSIARWLYRTLSVMADFQIPLVTVGGIMRQECQSAPCGRSHLHRRVYVTPAWARLPGAIHMLGLKGAGNFSTMVSTCTTCWNTLQQHSTVRPHTVYLDVPYDCYSEPGALCNGDCECLLWGRNGNLYIIQINFMFQEMLGETCRIPSHSTLQRITKYSPNTQLIILLKWSPYNIDNKVLPQCGPSVIKNSVKKQLPPALVSNVYPRAALALLQFHASAAPLTLLSKFRLSQPSSYQDLTTIHQPNRSTYFLYTACPKHSIQYSILLPT
jgi:hypothetical protein